MAINKKQFIDCMAASGGKTKKSCKEYLDLMFDTFYVLLEEGETVRFTGIMSETTKISPERQARNPKTGEKYNVPEFRRIKITASEVLRDRLNGKRD